MTEAYEYSLPASKTTVGWLAWEVTLRSEDQRTRTYSLGEHDGVNSAAEAVQAVFATERDADRCIDGATIIVDIVELRVLVSTEIHRN